jgi:hypothetical protein
MLQSYKQHIAANYAPAVETDISIDDLLSITPLTNAKLVFYNNEDLGGATDCFEIIVYNWLLLGVNDNPLNNGDFSYEIAHFDLANGRYEVDLGGSIDAGITQYSVSITNNYSTTAALHIVIEGVVDASTMVVIPD